MHGHGKTQGYTNKCKDRDMYNKEKNVHAYTGSQMQTKTYRQTHERETQLDTHMDTCTNGTGTHG
jgi:hypothetical protein